MGESDAGPLTAAVRMAVREEVALVLGATSSAGTGGAIEILTRALGDSQAEVGRLRAELAELRGGEARAPAQRAPEAPGRVLSKVCENWAKTKSRLPSFKNDLANAHRLLGIEPFPLGKFKERRLVFYVPEEGPFAGVKLADRDALTLGPEDVDLFVSWFYGQTTRRDGPPTPATINRYVMALKRMINFAVKRRTLPHSPIDGYEDEDEADARAVVIAEEHFDLILTALGDNLLMRAFVTLAYDSGMRKTELLYCRRSWLDQKAGQIHVPAAVAKNGEARITDLTPRAWAAVQLLPKNIKTDYLFVNPETNEPYDPSWIHDLFVRAVDISRVTGRDGTLPRIHDLRRSWVTLASRRGISDAVIMKKSGHKDHKVFRRYRIADDRDLHESFIAMERGRAKDLDELHDARRAGARHEPVIETRHNASL